MKRSFLTFLPIMAALLLATSCSKDDDTNTVINNEQTNAESAPVEVVAQPEYVKIPFSVKVDNGAKLSKISYSESDTKITRSFEQSDVDNNLTMAVTGDGIASGSTLTLKKDGDNFFFEGEIEVQSGREDDFTTTGIELTGTFGTPLTEAATSTTSLLDLMQNCAHQYKATFKSNTTEPIVIYDQNAYFHFSLASTQTQFVLEIGGMSTTFSSLSADKEIWVAVAGGTTVKGNLVSVSGMEPVASKIYNVNRTDVVDLGPSFSVLWCTTNLGASTPGDYGKYYAYGEPKGYNSDENHKFETTVSDDNFQDAATFALGAAYRMPTLAELKTLTGCGQKEETQDGNNGYKFFTDYGSVFFPAAGYCTSKGLLKNAGSNCYYYSCTPKNVSRAYNLYIINGTVFTGDGYRFNGQSVRAVRCMN